MKRVCADDLFETRRMSSFSSSDERILLDCYLPLLGGNAYALYQAFWALKAEELSVHERLMSRLRLSSGEFHNAVESLEALGLVRTFVKQDDNLACFIYCLYSPLSPEDFFDDPLLSGTLRKYVGEREYSLLKKKYKSASTPDGFEEATASFLSVFMPDFEDPIYLSSRFGALGHGSAKMRIDFDHRAFAARLVELGANSEMLSDQEIAKIERVSALYRLDSQTIADCAYESLDSTKRKGQRIDFETLSRKCANAARFGYTHQESATKSEVSGNNALAEKIRLMDQVSPVTFLSYLQGGHKPSSSDVKLVNRLALEIGLPDPVINALVDYILVRNNNILSSAYAEKVGAGLARSGVKNARDAMEYLNDASRKKRKAPQPAVSPTPMPSKDSQGSKERPLETKEPQSVSDEEVDKMLDELYNS